MKTVLTLILIPIFYYTKYYDVASLSLIAITLILIFAFKKTKLTVALSNFISSSFCLSPVLLSLTRHRFGPEPINNWSMMPTFFAANLVALLFLYLLNYLTLRCSRSQATLILILAVFGLSLFCFFRNPFIAVIGLILVAGVWYNAFFIFSIKSRSDLNIIDFLVCQQPFYSVSMVPLPPLLAARFDSRHVGAKEQSRATITTFFKFLFLLVAWFLIKQQLFNYSSNTLIRAVVYPHEMAGAGLASHINSNLSALESWIITLSAYLYTLLRLFSTFLPSLLILLLLGISINPEVDRPWRAKTLYQFYFLCNVNYSIIVSTMFIQPLYKLMYKLKYKKAVTFMSFSFGIAAAGVLFHYFSQIGGFSHSLSATTTITSFLPYSLYWFGIGVFVAASILLERGKIHQNENAFFKLLQRILYFSLASVLYILLRNYTLFQISIGERLRFMGSLFGVNL